MSSQNVHIRGLEPRCLKYNTSECHKDKLLETRSKQLTHEIDFCSKSQSAYRDCPYYKPEEQKKEQ